MEKTSLSRMIGALAVSLAMAFSFVLAGCSSGPKTLEEYMNTDEGKEEMKEIQAEADAMAASFGSLDVKVEGNNIIYNVKFDMTFDENPFTDGVFDDATIKQLSEAITQLEDESKVTGCTMEYIFKDSAGTVLYQVKIDKNGIMS